MGCIVARREFVEEHPEAVDAFLDLYGDSISFMSDEGNRSEATDNAKLQSIYDEINQLEKSKVEISQYTTYTEEYLRWAAAALALLLVEFLLRTLWLKSLP